MACTQIDWVGSTCKIESIICALLSLTLLAQLIDALGGQSLQLVNLHTNRLLLVGGNLAEVVHQGCNLTLLAQIFQSELLNFLSVFSAQILYFFQKFVYLIKYHKL